MHRVCPFFCIGALTPPGGSGKAQEGLPVLGHDPVGGRVPAVLLLVGAGGVHHGLRSVEVETRYLRVVSPLRDAEIYRQEKFCLGPGCSMSKRYSGTAAS